MNLLSTVVLSSVDEPVLWAAAGACAGIYLFYRGFRMLQRKRLILNTPSSKIRSASMGLVEVSGLAAGPFTMTAPVTGVPCYYYRTMAWQHRQSGKNKEWVKVADESLHVPFYLDDNTGKVLVNPQGAEMDIHRDFQEEFTGSFFSSSLDIPSNVSSFLIRHGVSNDKKIKIEEYCIKPKNALFILGTLAENPGVEVTPTPVPTEASHQLNFSMKVPSALAGGVMGALGDIPGVTVKTTVRASTTTRVSTPATGQEVIRLDGGQVPNSSADMTAQGKVAAALLKAGITNPAAWSAAGVSAPAVAVAGPGNGSAKLPGTTGDFDLHPKVALMKGTHNPAFFISWRSQRDVVKSISWKSTLMIWGGPALTLISVYFLMAHFGWL